MDAALQRHKVHAPNENARMDYFLKGILHAAAILDQLGKC